jgi:hypothetical protein
MWDPQLLTTLWASMACYRDSFTFITFTVLHSLNKSGRENYETKCRSEIKIAARIFLNLWNLDSTTRNALITFGNMSYMYACVGLVILVSIPPFFRAVLSNVYKQFTVSESILIATARGSNQLYLE